MLTTAQEVTSATEKAKMEITLKGTNGEEEILKLAIFMVVRSKMGGAKQEHLITDDMMEALMKAIGECVWEVWERKYKACFPKSRTNTCLLYTSDAADE